MAEPPYLRIAAEIRRRIADGRLRPGDRVPSTRQIAQEWGVALATATKVLTRLRQEGLVHARPRVGTVVASPATAEPGSPGDPGSAGSPSSAGSPGDPGSAGSPSSAGSLGEPAGELSRERVVRTAIDLADAEGLDALSMRGVAARLGVATMTIYRHVAGKDELVLLMADTAFGELGYPEEPPGGWRARAERAARTLWAVHRRHPWLAQLNSLFRPLPLPNLLVHGEQLLAALEELGLDDMTRMDLQVVIYSNVQGLAAHLEREVLAEAATGLSDEQWMRTHEPALGSIAASGHYPAFARLMAGFARDGYDLDLDRLFELGLRTLLDGVAVLAPEARG
ncbi:TetR/AcrR family transcriptional regulator C-terminal domain-containing protein [Nonomuraea sp. NPDC047897]|uniref:TetR/AcrR family transcriptional regulator C-terminal domain-containing protein n=1 Tax=Nonomuraea sp. NPDC047897 TaxID=3364346 RepID=UPI0037178631